MVGVNSTRTHLNVPRFQPGTRRFRKNDMCRAYALHMSFFRVLHARAMSSYNKSFYPENAAGILSGSVYLFFNSLFEGACARPQITHLVIPFSYFPLV